MKEAIILAAGFGTRLKPLTNNTPKALIPFPPYKLIDFCLFKLGNAGIKKAVINLHYLGEKISSYLGRTKYGIELIYSYEEEILGTGGGIKKAANFLHDDNIFLHNADILSDLNVQNLINAHTLNAHDATLVLRQKQTGEKHTGFKLDQNHKILCLDESALHHYTGIAILHQNFIEELPQAGKPACFVQDGLIPMLKKQAPLYGFLHNTYWSDVGTHEKYNEAKCSENIKKLLT